MRPANRQRDGERGDQSEESDRERRGDPQSTTRTEPTMRYDAFLEMKKQEGADHGFEPLELPDILFPFQKHLTAWALKKGRAAIFADCGLGKTFMQIAWANNVAKKTNGRVIIFTPLAVAFQTVLEGEKIGIEVIHRNNGKKNGDRIVVTNYERLHHFDPEDYVGVVCDESSILKNFDGATRQAITDFMRKRPYRLLCTATAAPNDYIELGTSSEALGEMGAQDMLNMFFKRDSNYHRIANMAGQGWAMRSHADHAFWSWVCSWARAMRKPSDLGFEDNGFKLPPLEFKRHVVKSNTPRDGFLFDVPSVGLDDQRKDLRHTIEERCQASAGLINGHKKPAVAWCNLNREGDLLTKYIDDAIQVSGKDAEEYKEEVFKGFIDGEVRVLVTKPRIGGFGLNLQHCAHQTYFPSHSYEQFYQSVRRSWRFGQTSKVLVDMITTEGQSNVLENLQRKSKQADKMFDMIVRMMSQEMKITQKNEYTKQPEVPAWL
jgi:hypothetical protein